MDYFDKLDKIDLRELLNKNWMTHDGKWFLFTVQTCGIEGAIEGEQIRRFRRGPAGAK